MEKREQGWIWERGERRVKPVGVVGRRLLGGPITNRKQRKKKRERQVQREKENSHSFCSPPLLACREGQFLNGAKKVSEDAERVQG